MTGDIIGNMIYKKEMVKMFNTDKINSKYFMCCRMYNNRACKVAGAFAYLNCLKNDLNIIY